MKYKKLSDNNDMVTTTSNMDMYENLHRAAGFDANRSYPLLFQHLGYRKLLAEEILRGGELHRVEALEKAYEYINNEIKDILGL